MCEQSYAHFTPVVNTMAGGIPESFELLPLDLELPVARMAALIGVQEKNFCAWMKQHEVHVRRIMTTTMVCRRWLNEANPPQSYATIPLPGRKKKEAADE